MEDISFLGEKNNQKIDEHFESLTYPKAKQSANTLFHFVRKLEHLFDILEKQCLYPRYCPEKYLFLPKDFPVLIFPMKCFCNIYLEKLYLHCNDYGQYGIGFERDALINKGVQPVQYINQDSALGKELYHEAKKLLDKGTDFQSDRFYSHNKFFSRLKYSKPLSDIVPGKNKEAEKFLPDEMEWRFVPPNCRKSGCASFLNQTFSPAQIQSASDKIENEGKLGLHYEYSDIKYIIVPDAGSRMKLAMFIWKDLNVSEARSEEIKLNLISKIVELNQMNGDV